MTEGIEKAVLFSRIKDVLTSGDDYDRLYFGHEFCQRLMPGADTVRKAYDYANSNDIDFTLVTPFVTNAGLRLVREVVNDIAEYVEGKPFEIVVNDWGVLHWVHKNHPEISLVLGRLLVKQKRGPRLLNITRQLPPAAVEHFQRSNVDVPHVQEFLEKKGVGRVELDNLLQGIHRVSGLPASLYYPYGYISTTRLCLLTNGDKPDKNLRSLGICHQECQMYDILLKHTDMPVPITLKGNTQFFRNEKMPEDLARLNVTRIVETVF